MIMYFNQPILHYFSYFLGNGSGWIIDLVREHHINTSKYNPLAGSSYIKLPKQLKHRRKGLINI